MTSPKGLAVIKPGLFTTVQDLGRTGYRAFGVPLAGAFDRGSASLANALLGNSPDCAVLELALNGGEYEARIPLALALAGAPLKARIWTADWHEIDLTPPVAFPMAEGDRLVLGGTVLGARAYLAVLGGWRTPAILGSRSSETPLRAGDLVPCDPGWSPVRHPSATDDPFQAADVAPIRVVDGPDAKRLRFARIDPEVSYRVDARSDRMGLRLAGPTWEIEPEPDRISAPVAPGAVQSAGGRPLVLGVACGTMGGYPHVAHVISADLDRVAQARPGDVVRFARVSLGEARRLDRLAREDRARKFLRIATAASDRGSRGFD